MFQQESHVPQGCNGISSRLHRLLVRLAGSGRVAQLLAHNAEVSEHLGRLRLQFESLLVSFGGLIQAAGFLMG